jgi:hypothetical protein
MCIVRIDFCKYGQTTTKDIWNSFALPFCIPLYVYLTENYLDRINFVGIVGIIIDKINLVEVPRFTTISTIFEQE